MQDKEQLLNEIFSDDPFGLLNVSPKKSYAKSSDERLAASFEAVNDFVAEFNREPQPNPSNITEFQLYATLKGIRENEGKRAALKDIDKHGLIQEPQEEEFNSIDDILSSDGLNLLGGDIEDSLFTFNHTPKELERAKADYISKRKKCLDFDKFKHLFNQVQDDLAAGKRKIVKFKETSLQEGGFYIYNGVMMYLESVDFTKDRIDYPSGQRAQKNGRTRCVFENGTESNMLYRSAIRALYDNGQMVTHNIDDVKDELLNGFNQVTEQDQKSGHIYILSSLSKKPEIAQMENLYKIGFTSQTVESRISNAKNEPTYLMDEVNLISAWTCFNMNAKKFESLVHQFFGAVRLNIDVYDNQGNRHSPREWFVAPLEVIEEAVSLITTGKIVGYRYDVEAQSITPRD